MLSDEGIGIHVVQKLQNMALPPEVEVIDGGTGGFELLTHCRGKKKVIFIDAMNIAAEPGAVFRFALEELPETWRPALSAHEGGVQELLHFCKTLVPPPEVIIYSVAPQETQRLSMQLGEMLARRLDEIVALLAAEVKEGIQDWEKIAK